MSIAIKYVLEDQKLIDWDGVCFARDTTSDSWNDFFRQLEYSAKIKGGVKFKHESDSVIIDSVEYDIEKIDILNFSNDVYFFKLVKVW